MKICPHQHQRELDGGLGAVGDMGFKTKVGSFVVLPEAMRAARGSPGNAGGEVGPSITGHEICMVS